MDNHNTLTLLIAFVLGYFAHQMMGDMCGNRLFEFSSDNHLNTNKGPDIKDFETTLKKHITDSTQTLGGIITDSTQISNILFYY